MNYSKVVKIIDATFTPEYFNGDVLLKSKDSTIKISQARLKSLFKAPFTFAAFKK